MPIFRSESLQNKTRRSRLERASTQGAIDQRGKVVRLEATRWAVRHTTFSAIDKYNFGQLSKTINEVAAKNPKQKVFVLDWGCGNGAAARQLAEEDSRTKVFGFSVDSDERHLGPGKATILNTSVNAFHRYLNSKKIMFDVVYSNLGLGYLSNFDNYIIRLAEHVKVGGTIFPGYFLTASVELNEESFQTFRNVWLAPLIMDGRLVALRKVK